MSIVVTGSTGRIGSRVVAQLAASGAREFARETARGWQS